MSGTYLHTIPVAPVCGSRDDELVRLCAARRVIHVGCTDAPFTAEKLEMGGLLHSKLLSVAHQLLGIDIDEPGLALLRDGLGGDYASGDVTTAEGREQILAGDAEVILASDVVEHVPDEFAFLTGLADLARRSSNPKCVVAVSTPNALALRQIAYTGFGREVIHPDHRRVHTPQTLGYAMQSAGMVVDHRIYYMIRSGDTRPRRIVDFVCRSAARFRPGYADGLIIVARPTP
jgi:hypothetical protein